MPPLKDLNYRLNLPDADVRHLLCSVPTSRGIHTLLQFDEVRMLANAVDVPLLNYSPPVAEEFYSSLQSIYRIRRATYNFLSVRRIR